MKIKFNFLEDTYMKYLKLSALSIITISAASLSLLYAADHDPVKNFAELLHFGAQNCNTKIYDDLDFRRAYITSVMTVTQKEGVKAFKYKIDNETAISLAKSIGGTNCMEYVEGSLIMEKFFEVRASVPGAENLTLFEISEKEEIDPEFKQAMDKACDSVE